MQIFNQHLKGDRGIWVIIATLTLISVLAVYTSTSGLAFQQRDGDTEYYLFKHMALMALGLIMMFFVHRLDYRIFARFANLLMIISGLLLLYTLFQGQAAEVNDARRWIRVFGQSFQPSDLAKFSLMIYLAKVLTQRQELIRDFRRSFVPTILPVFVICGLIAPYNLSTALVLMMTSFILMFIAGISSRHMTTLMLSGFMLATVAIYGNLFQRSVTWQHRISDWMSGQVDQQEQFQREQANIAIATSGFFGKGAGRSIQRHYLPQASSDFVFAIIIEEYGMFGGLIVLLLYILLMIRAVGIVTISKTFGALLAAGLSFLIVIQALINMGVTVGLLPVTGLALPLISMGGTSLLFTAMSFGVILSVSRTAIEEKLA